MNKNNYVVIMAGGIGSRFWPKSRKDFPKQFIDILGVGKSLLQMTYDRFIKVCPKENIYVVTHFHYLNLVREQLVGCPVENIISEPSRNNTAPCIAYASFKIFQKNSEANIIVAPSDHLILQEFEFLETLHKALVFSQKHEALVALGISPTRPDTGYGYIKYKKHHSKFYQVIQFTEKPCLQKAEEFVKSGEYLWNAGIFIWKASTILNAFEAYSPEIYTIFKKGEAFYNTGQEKLYISTNYPNTPNISIDYAIMEQANNVYTIPGEFGWSDLGTWASLYEISEKDESENVVSAKELKLENTEGCIINIKNKTAVIRGLKHFIIVDDGDFLLIYPRRYEQDIKRVATEFI